MSILVNKEVEIMDKLGNLILFIVFAICAIIFINVVFFNNNDDGACDDSNRYIEDDTQWFEACGD
jgi:hypothetical protein